MLLLCTGKENRKIVGKKLQFVFIPYPTILNFSTISVVVTHLFLFAFSLTTFLMATSVRNFF